MTLALDLDLFSRGGLEILRAIERADYDVLSARPAISRFTKLGLAFRALGGKALPFLRLGSQIIRKGCLSGNDSNARTDIASRLLFCRAIAKREAKNFYYAFIALPAERRNAICAIYAFMRQADDIADDESLSIHERRACLETWFDAWDATVQSGTTLNPVFLAVHDATRALIFRSRFSTNWLLALPWI